MLEPCLASHEEGAVTVIQPEAQPSPRTFDFDTWGAYARDMTQLIRSYAAHPALRSAMVDELELDEEFHRRAARPEDLSFISFGTPVNHGTVTQLPFLASQRLLLSIYESEIAGLPRDGSAESFARVAAFCADEHRLAGAQITPFLEAFSFDFLERAEALPSAELADQLAGHLSADAAHFRAVFDRLKQRGYVEQGVRYALIQRWSLAASKRAALARAAAARFFEPLGPELAPRLNVPSLPDAALRRLALHCGVNKRQHSYWQFYLSTSLASCNLLYALTRRPDRALSAYGALFAAEAEWLGFGCLAGAAARELGLPEIPVGDSSELVGRFRRVLALVEQRWGARGLLLVGRGLGAALQLSAAARRNFGEQVRWLSSVDIHQEIARRLDQRIAAERPDIDRETFIEPREMCSTTHVHDDHRLVVIETGHMVFWGNLGMTLRLAPGEMVLVPQGRLHGSSIESDECVYHQPIIPEEWIVPLRAELDPDGAALTS
jgi:hypothetical protein